MLLRRRGPLLILAYSACTDITPSCDANDKKLRWLKGGILKTRVDDNDRDQHLPQVRRRSVREKKGPSRAGRTAAEGGGARVSVCLRCPAQPDTWTVKL